VVHALERAGFRAMSSRAARGGYQSGEDVVTNFPLSVEVKNQTRLDLPGWWRQAQEQAGDVLPVVIHKRVGKARAEEWWATMDFQTLLDLVRVLSWDLEAIRRDYEIQRNIERDAFDYEETPENFLEVLAKVRKELAEKRRKEADGSE
jgi:hypothetical protein